jgi:hypothetical protein
LKDITSSKDAQSKWDNIYKWLNWNYILRGKILVYSFCVFLERSFYWYTIRKILY